jgi:hypothetical protein
MSFSKNQITGFMGVEGKLTKSGLQVQISNLNFFILSLVLLIYFSLAYKLRQRNYREY